jgi:hypothetical protein
MTEPRCCDRPDVALLGDEGFECLNCGRVLGHRRPTSARPLNLERTSPEEDEPSPDEDICPDHGPSCPGLGLCDWQSGSGKYTPATCPQCAVEGEQWAIQQHINRDHGNIERTQS